MIIGLDIGRNEDIKKLEKNNKRREQIVKRYRELTQPLHPLMNKADLDFLLSKPLFASLKSIAVGGGVQL